MILDLAVVLGLATLGLSATYDHINDIPNLNWDFIVVGGGTAGSVIASRLTENSKFNVLVLEAGPTNTGVTTSIIPGLAPRIALSRYDWNYTTTPQPGLNNRSIPYERGHILGGSSSVNGMFYTRGSSSDYNRYAEHTRDSGWSWNNIQKYLREQEKFEEPADNHNITGQYSPSVHSTTGRVPVTLPGFLNFADTVSIQASNELGGDFRYNEDMNSGTPLGVGWMPGTIGHDGTRSSAATTYLDDKTRARRNLHIVTNTRVTRLLQTQKTKDLTIRSVEVRASATAKPVVLTASKEVILSGGTMGTPLILMHSGIADADKLRKLGIKPLLDNRSVGQNFSDHVYFRLSFNVAPGSLGLGHWGNISSDPALQAEALAQWNKNRTGPYVQDLPVGVIAWTRLPENVTKGRGDPSSGPNSAHLEFVASAAPNAYGFSIGLVSPMSRGTVTIASNNPFDGPLLNPGYYTSDFDLLAAREAIKLALKYTSAPVFRNVITGLGAPFANAKTDAEINDVLRNGSFIGSHAVGTASMSPKGARWGVVDPDLLVKNVKGLRIIDASVLPFVPCAHSQVATYVVAERGADLIRSTWE